jgi:hypothetical protein
MQRAVVFLTNLKVSGAELWPVKCWRVQTREINNYLNGIEWGTAQLISSLRLLSVSFWGANLLLKRKWGEEKPHDRITEGYVLAVFMTLATTLWLSTPAATWMVYFVFYFLAELMVIIAASVLLRKLPSAKPPISIERSLILLVINAAEITVGFAVLYRVLLPADRSVALLYAVSVFATIGAPANIDAIVIAQFACNFIFLTVFIATYVTSLGSLTKLERR